MPYNSLIDRTEAAPLIPEEVSRDIMAAAAQASTFLQLARRLPDASRAQVRMPVLNALPTAYFVNGDIGMKQTTEVAWTNVYVNIEEIACIVPIPQAVLDDADYDIWAEAKPRIAEAIGRTVDAAVYHGTNKPASWPTGIVAAALAAGNASDVSTGAAATPKLDLYDTVFGVGGTIALLETDGYFPTGVVATPAFRGMMRGLRSVTNGLPVFQTNVVPGPGVQSFQYSLDGMPLVFAMNGGLDNTAAHLIAADWRNFVYAVRQDITYKVLTEAVITDAANAIIYNLAQQDMVALRVVYRMGWAVANPVNVLQPVAASRYPAATLVP